MTPEEERAAATARFTRIMATRQPLEFSLSLKGLAITGCTNSAKELKAFLKKLEELAAFLPEEDGAHLSYGEPG